MRLVAFSDGVRTAVGVRRGGVVHDAGYSEFALIRQVQDFFSSLRYFRSEKRNGNFRADKRLIFKIK